VEDGSGGYSKAVVRMVSDMSVLTLQGIRRRRMFTLLILRASIVASFTRIISGICFKQGGHEDGIYVCNTSIQ
jgi:hypothetical protein